MSILKLSPLRIQYIFLLLALLFACRSAKKITYPESRKESITDIIWGDTIEDPYRWLEEIDSEATQNWIKTQSKFALIQRGDLFRTMKDYIRLYKFADFKPLTRQGNYYFHQRITDLKKAPLLFFQSHPNKRARMLFDPNTIHAKHKFTIDEYNLSPDEKTLALTMSLGGSDWKTIRFLDMRRRKLMPDSIGFVKYSPVHWSDDGIFYIRYKVDDIRESFSGLIGERSIYYHKLGTSQSDDLLIFDSDSEKTDFRFEVTPEKKFLILYHTIDEEGKAFQAVSYRKLPLNKTESFKPFIISQHEGIYYNVIGATDSRLLVESNLNAPNGAILSYVPEGINQGDILIPPLLEKLEHTQLINGIIFRVYYNGFQSFALLSDTNGKDITAWSLPEGYFFSGFSGSQQGNLAIYHFNSFFSPGSYYSINLETFERKPLGNTMIFFSINDLTTRKVWYTSADGTSIPMYLTHKKNLKPNRAHPVLLYGYGGFGISMTPFYDAGNLIFIKNGGILATPCLRGGGEFPGWHKQGMKHNKQNTIDDFTAAAEYLIKEGLTYPGLIAAMGGSHGGLVVGAAMVQRPELFRVVVSNAGVFDMLRYHLYNIGYLYEDEIGNINDSLDFVHLKKYSPYHNVGSGVNYPATLLLAAANDDRVNPFHSFKFLARLQEQNSGDRPIVLYFEENAGHSGTKIMNTQLETEAYIYSFIFQQLGMNRRAEFQFFH